MLSFIIFSWCTSQYFAQIQLPLSLWSCWSPPCSKCSLIYLPKIILTSKFQYMGLGRCQGERSLCFIIQEDKGKVDCVSAKQEKQQSKCPWSLRSQEQMPKGAKRCSWLWEMLKFYERWSKNVVHGFGPRWHCSYQVKRVLCECRDLLVC